MSRPVRVVLGLSMVAALLYLALLLTLYVVQPRLIYPGWWRGTAAVPLDLARFRDVGTRTQDGLKGRLLYAPPRPGMPVILFFHGNGDSVAGSAAAVQPFLATGYGAVLPEYRGYAGLPGTPDEQGLYCDARAARRWMADQGIAPARTIVIGHSLGSGVATQSAAEERPAALVLIAGFASVAHVVREHFAWIPAGLLVTERFNSVARIGGIDCPILLVHGDADATVPPDNARLLAAARPGARLATFAGVGHEVAWNPAARAEILRWMGALPGR